MSKKRWCGREDTSPRTSLRSLGSSSKRSGNSHFLDRYTFEAQQLTEQAWADVAYMRQRLRPRRVAAAVAGGLLLGAELLAASPAAPAGASAQEEERFLLFGRLSVCLLVGAFTACAVATWFDEICGCGGANSWVNGEASYTVAGGANGAGGWKRRRSCWLVGCLNGGDDSLAGAVRLVLIGTCMWALCGLISIAAPPRRQLLLGFRAAAAADGHGGVVAGGGAVPGHGAAAAAEPCEEGATALWIALAHATVAVFGLLPPWAFVVVSQFGCLQHMVLGLLLPRPECNFAAEAMGGLGGGPLLGLQPLAVATLQLSLLDVLLAFASWRVDAERRLERFAQRLVRHRERDSVFGDPGDDCTVKNCLEVVITEMRHQEVQCRRVVADARSALPVMEESVAWLCAVGGLLSMLSKASLQLESKSAALQRMTLGGRSTLTAPSGPSGLRTGITGFIAQSFMKRTPSNESFNGGDMSASTDAEAGGPSSGTGASALGPSSSFAASLPTSSFTPSFASCSLASLAVTLAEANSAGAVAAARPSVAEEEEDAAATDVVRQFGGAAAAAILHPLLPPVALLHGETLRLSDSEAGRLLGRWQFDALQVEAQHGQVLQRVGFEFLQHYSFIRRPALVKFLARMEACYVKENPYHMHVHGADVCNAMVFLVTSVGLWGSSVGFNDAKRVAVILAALGHDIGHVGYSNHFLVATRHQLATIYNDRSVLENFHAAKLAGLLGGDGGGRVGGDAAAASAAGGKDGLLSELPDETFTKIRQLLIALILATDTQTHLEGLAEFRCRLNSWEASSRKGAAESAEGDPPPFDPVLCSKDQQQTLCTMFRAADVGHSAKSWELHQEWSMRVVREFHAQGDEELRRGLPVSPLCDRQGFNLARSQVGFLQFVCLPTWREMARLEAMLAARFKRMGQLRPPPPGAADATSFSHSRPSSAGPSWRAAGNSELAMPRSPFSPQHQRHRPRQQPSPPPLRRTSFLSPPSLLFSSAASLAESSEEEDEDDEEDEEDEGARPVNSILESCERNLDAWQQQADADLATAAASPAAVPGQPAASPAREGDDADVR